MTARAPGSAPDSAPDASHVAGRATMLCLTAVVAVAIVGFFVGIDDGVPLPDAAPALIGDSTAVGTDGGVVPAVSYAEIAEARPSTTRDRIETLDRLLRRESLVPGGIEIDPSLKVGSLALRSERRAYNGAPPVIPHEVGATTSDACLICHGAGFALESRSAKQLPHPYLANCTQCHVAPSPSILASAIGASGERAQLADNAFVGVAAPLEGERAWVGAPPVVPHATWMRDNCMACHGPQGWPGMRTSHPERANCLQCHAPTAVLERRPASLERGALLPPIAVEGR